MPSIVPGAEGAAAEAAEAEKEEGAEGRWVGCSAGGMPAASVPLWRGRWPWLHFRAVPARTSAASLRNLPAAQEGREELEGGQVGPLLGVAATAVADVTVGCSLAGDKPHRKSSCKTRAAAAPAAAAAGEPKKEVGAGQKPELAQVLDQGEGGMLHKGEMGRGGRGGALVAVAAWRALAVGGEEVQEQVLRKNQYLPGTPCLPHGRGFLVLLHALLPRLVLHLACPALPGLDSRQCCNYYFLCCCSCR